MTKPFYADYVNRMLRFYARSGLVDAGGEIRFRTTVDKQNWESVDRVLQGLSKRDKYVIMEVYGRGDTLADNIYEIAKELRVNQDSIWSLISKVTRKIAKERKLI